MPNALQPGQLIRDARRSAKLTQAQLARRLGTTQPVIARLESARSNPTVATIERALNATGHGLRLGIEHRRPAVDESLIRKHLERSPHERIAALEEMHAEAQKIALAGERARGRRS